MTAAEQYQQDLERAAVEHAQLWCAKQTALESFLAGANWKDTRNAKALEQIWQIVDSGHAPLEKDGAVRSILLSMGFGNNLKTEI